MSVNMNYQAFRKTMADQRRRLRQMADKVEDDFYENMRDVYLPNLVQDIAVAVPKGGKYSTGYLAEHGISYKLNRTKRKQILLTVSAKAYNQGYNYAYIQHENVEYAHEQGTHHYVSGPFEIMLRDIADTEGFDYVAPADDESIFGAGGEDNWAPE